MTKPDNFPIDLILKKSFLFTLTLEQRLLLPSSSPVTSSVIYVRRQIIFHVLTRTYDFLSPFFRHTNKNSSSCKSNGLKKLCVKCASTSQKTLFGADRDKMELFICTTGSTRLPHCTSIIHTDGDHSILLIRKTDIFRRVFCPQL